MKRILLPVLVIGILLLTGCGQLPSEPPPEGIPPISPITMQLSFPDGAPPLNQEAELICIVKPQCILKNMSIEIRLPEGFELVSGELSWVGDITSGDDLE